VKVTDFAWKSINSYSANSDTLGRASHSSPPPIVQPVKLTLANSDRPELAGMVTIKLSRVQAPPALPYRDACGSTV